MTKFYTHTPTHTPPHLHPHPHHPTHPYIYRPVNDMGDIGYESGLSSLQKRNISSVNISSPRKRRPALTWWRHQMETFSALLAICSGNSPVPGEFPTQRPVTRSFDVFFDLRPNKRLSKQWWCWWFETQSCPLWRHCNEWLHMGHKDIGFGFPCGGMDFKFLYIHQGVIFILPLNLPKPPWVMDAGAFALVYLNLSVSEITFAWDFTEFWYPQFPHFMRSPVNLNSSTVYTAANKLLWVSS